MVQKKWAPNDYLRDSQNRTVHDVAIQVQLKTQRISVGTSSTPLPTTALVDRQFIRVQNVGNNPVYIGDFNVTSTIGWVVLPFASETFAAEDTATVYAISAGSVDVIVMEGL